MAKYIYYNDVVVATVEDGKISLDAEGIEKSGMPLSWRPHIRQHLLNALPEGIRLETLAALVSEDGAEILRAADLVPWVDELPGRFSAGNSPTPADTGEIERYVPIPEDVTEGTVTSRLSAAWLHPQSPVRAKRKPSFSGYQDKFVAKLAVENGKPILSAPAPGERGNVIVKPGNPQYPFIAENEFVCMQLAKGLGFHVPRVFLFRQPDAASEIERKRKHFLVERFDYTLNQIDKAGKFKKLAITEMAALMNLTSKTKYDTTTEELFRTAQSSFDSEGLRIFARMYFFGILTGNGDMHAKNFSLVLDPGDRSYRPSPLYDCLCTSVYGFNDMLALPLGNSNRPKPAEVTAFMRSFLSDGEMEKMATGILGALDALLPLAFDSEAPAIQTARKRLRNAIANHTRSILKAILGKRSE
ncbi:MAG: HipA domain-containing protein [Synergistaceae bacterium]|jgi:hypothetical protein|nr:HipA domain-containing protein [Synergistaceae bacterium]